MRVRKSKYDPYEEQIRALLAKGLFFHQVSQILVEQGIDSTSDGLYRYAKSRRLCGARRVKPQKKKRASCRGNHKTIEEIVVAAKSAGMTYGQYVALEYSQSKQ